MTPEIGRRYRFRIAHKRAVEATFVGHVQSPSHGLVLHIQTSDGRHRFLPEVTVKKIEVAK